MKKIKANHTLIEHKTIANKAPINSVKSFIPLAYHKPHKRLATRKQESVHLTHHEHLGLNGKIALKITNLVGTMWCAYAFAILALISLPEAIKGGLSTLIAWIAQTFLQLVLLSVIMVGQKVSAAASDKQASQTFKDTEALLEIQDDIHRLTKEIHYKLIK